MLNEYRAVLGGLFGTLWGLSADQVQRVFPGSTPVNLQLARVDKASLFQDRDYPVLNEYRAVLGGLFGTLWGLSADQIQRVFPGSTPVHLQLV